MAYLKALHIIFIVTWFAGLFYMPRLLIYSTEAGERPAAERDVLRGQFAIMMKRLWYGITWPSAIITLIFGLGLLFQGWHRTLFTEAGTWITIKLGFVVALYGYQLFLHWLTKEMLSGRFRLTSMQLRVWNEVATVFLVAIVFLAVVKQGVSLLWGLGGLVLLMVVLMGAIGVYRKIRNKPS